MTIHNKPDYANNYEFVVARPDEDSADEFWFWGAYEDGFMAEKAAVEIGGFVFHNERI